MTKKWLFSLALALGAVFWGPPAEPSAQTVKSEWATAPLNIDGLEDDWPGVALAKQKNVNVDYAFRNDDQDLYVIMIFKEPKFLSSIDATGINVFFNLEGKKKKDRSFRFFKKMVQAEEFIASLEKKGQTVPDEEKARLRAQNAFVMYDYEFLTKGKAPASSAPQPAPDAPHLSKFRSKRTGTTTVYEFRIPLAASAAQPAGIAVEPGQVIKIGFEWGGMTEEMKAARLKRSTPETAREDLDRWGPGSSRDPASGPPQYDFWVDVQLAAKPPSSSGVFLSIPAI